jgi:GMP reductase
MKIEQELKLDFSDVLIRPKRSTLSSRSEVELLRTFVFKNRKGGIKKEWTGIPIMAANMDTTGTFEMYRELSKFRMITCFHKHYQVEDYPENLDSDYYAISSGITDNDYLKLQKTIDRLSSTQGGSPTFLCIDVANGYMLAFANFVKKVSDNYPNLIIICGNVVSREIVEELIINCGADIVKCGIGSGATCITRSQTGVGMPQLSCIIECGDAAHGVNGKIASDGGCVVPGDLSKAFGANTDFIMLGSMLAGHTESGGELVEDTDGKQYKMFYGMSSKKAMEKYSGGMASHRSSEGKVVKIPYKGDVKNTIENILGGIRSTCTYIGAKTLKDMPKCTSFMRVTNQLNNSLNKFNH